MKQLILFITLIAVLSNTACNIFDREDEKPFIIDTLTINIVKHHPILYGDAEYVKDYFRPGFPGLDSTMSHFDTTLTIDKIASDDSLLTVMYGYPMIFKSDGPDTEVTFLGGYLNGDRAPYDTIIIMPHDDCFDCPRIVADSIVYDTVYWEYPLMPSYAIFEIITEGQTTIDTVLVGQNEYASERFYYYHLGNHGNPAAYDADMLNFLNSKEFTRNDYHKMFDHNLINSPEKYEVYFIDFFSGFYPLQPAGVDMKFYIRRFN